MRRIALAGAALLGIGALAVGCGSASRSPTSSTGTTTAAQSDAQAKAAAAKAAEARYQKCRSQIGPLLKAEEALASHLSSGMNYHDYTSEVAKVKAVSDHAPSSKLEYRCRTKVATRLNKAVREYISAADEWKKCAGEIKCPNAQIRIKLQQHWLRATGLLVDAKDALDGLGAPTTASSS